MNRSPDPVTEVSLRGGAPLTGPVLMTWDAPAPKHGAEVHDAPDCGDDTG